MEIPLSLAPRRDGSLVYALPLWYRILMAAILALVGAALLPGGEPPGVAGWIILALILLACVYEERWTFDAARGTVSHRAGLVFLARRTEIPFSEIGAIRFRPFVRGTVPGSAEEAAENRAALEGGREDDAKPKRSLVKKPYLCLIVESPDGTSYLVDAVPARKVQAFRATASRIASYCGKALVEG